MSLVKTERIDYIAWISMNRPEKGNALSTSLMREIIGAVKEVERDPSVRIVIFSGEGKFFSSGVDLSEISSASSPEDVERIFRVLAELFKTLLNLSKPLIIAINGDAYGGGAEMIWTGDVVLAVEDARLGWVESRWGLIPPALSGVGALVIGFARASLIALTSGVISAREAYQYGMISYLTTREKLRDDAIRIARSIISTSAPESIESIKNIMRNVKTGALLDLGVSELLRLSRSGDLIRRARDFIEKKQYPVY
ncbi:MAG: enoyl-CoA hydratase/isomerase family protein [Sulfolobales archaeon]